MEPSLMVSFGTHYIDSTQKENIKIPLLNHPDEKNEYIFGLEQTCNILICSKDLNFINYCPIGEELIQLLATIIWTGDSHQKSRFI